MAEQQQDPTGTALRHAFQAAKQHDTPATRDALKQSVWAFADECRKVGWAPERVLIALKEHAKSVGFRITPRDVPRIGRIAPKGPDTDVLFKQVVSWCIERYYKENR